MPVWHGGSKGSDRGVARPLLGHGHLLAEALLLEISDRKVVCIRQEVFDSCDRRRLVTWSGGQE